MMTDKEHEVYQKDMRERALEAHAASNLAMEKRVKEVYHAVCEATAAEKSGGNYLELTAARIEGACRIVAAEIGRGKYP
jgi:hypothetical protein